MAAINIIQSPSGYYGSERPTSARNTFVDSTPDKQTKVTEQGMSLDTGTSTLFSVMRLVIDTSGEGQTSTHQVRDHSNEYSELVEEVEWVINFFSTAHELSTVKELLPYYQEINKLLVEKKFSLCNMFLNQIQVSGLSDVLLVGVLRLTSNWKSSLPAWKQLLQKAMVELESRSLDAKSMLKGLE